MEQKIENAIDNGLESIASQLYIFSVGFGVILIIIGIVLFLTGKRSKDKRAKSNAGLICAIIGIIAIVSGLLQML